MDATDATSLYVGPGVRIEGRISQDSKEETIVIAGVLAGDIITQGRVVVESGGKIEAANELKCFELDVKGRVEGGDVLVEAGILRLGQTAKVSVSDISLPPGGLEQSRGSVLCAKLRMDSSNAFAQDERLQVQDEAGKSLGEPVWGGEAPESKTGAAMPRTAPVGVPDDAVLSSAVPASPAQAASVLSHLEVRSIAEKVESDTQKSGPLPSFLSSFSKASSIAAATVHPQEARAAEGHESEEAVSTFDDLEADGTFGGPSYKA